VAVSLIPNCVRFDVLSFDFITLDDGEMPIEELINAVTSTQSKLKQLTLFGKWKSCILINSKTDYKQSQSGNTDYSDLLLDKYISVIEIVNPCTACGAMVAGINLPWPTVVIGKCTFCDISLDYIKIYEPVAANLLCDRMEK
jgi:hypothetical protein